ncbi:MAG: hypothetical protein GAK45_01245 [Pseudomonas citronellolis]|nr:MAG: hypothetical protein GAK45_01245 [Pseudomonas citronellolis]
MDTPTDNPFRTPTALLSDGSATTATASPLYKLSAVGLATLFGTPLAGAWVLQHNLRAMGLASRSTGAWIAAVVLLIGTLLIGVVFRSNLPIVPVAVLQVFVMHQYARKLLGAEREAVPQYYSNWRAFGIALLFRVAVTAALLVVALLIL